MRGSVDTAVVAEVSGLGEVARHRGALEALWAETEAPIYARWTAIEVWARHHPEDPLWGLVVYGSAGQARAAALLTRRRRLGCHRIGRPGEATEPAFLPARDEAAADELAGAIGLALRRLDRPWTLHLGDLPRPDPVVAALRSRLSNVALHPGPDAPYLDVSPARTAVSRNTRSAVAKARNRVAREGHTLAVAWTASPAGVDAALPEIVAVHRRRNRQVRGWAALDSAAATALFVETVRAHAADGNVRLLTVRIDTTLAAFALCLHDGEILRVHANLVSPDWLRYSAGTIANAEVARAAAADPAIRRLDWGAGVARYKVSGDATLRPSQHLHAWSSGAVRLAWSAKQGVTHIPTPRSAIAPG